VIPLLPLLRRWRTRRRPSVLCIGSQNIYLLATRNHCRY
jgi:hypothetical protein